MDQDDILDSDSNDSADGDEENWSNQVESEWSDFDPIFHTDEQELTAELQEQNELNPPDRQVNIDDVLDQMKRD